MSDDVRDVDLTDEDTPDDSDAVVSDVAPGQEPLDTADTDAARANYATFAVALAKDAEAQRDAEVTEGPEADPDVAAEDDDEVFALEADDTVYSGLEEPTEVVAVPVVEAEDPDVETEPKKTWWRDIWRRQITLKPIPVILVLLLLASAGLATWLYFQYYRPDQQTSQSVARAAINAASDGTVALLSYSSDSLDKDFASARTHLSGDFLSYYDQFTSQVVAPAAKQKALKTSTHVVRVAVQELRPTSAVVLVFADQSTTSKDNPEPSMAARSVLVNLALVDGKWLITKFTPV